MTTERIDPGAVAAWFQAHPDIKAMQGLFATWEHRCSTMPLACCGLTARALAEGSADFPHKDNIDELNTKKTTQVLGRIIGVGGWYAYGFAKGWDGAHLDAGLVRDFQLGYADGKDAYLLTMAAVEDRTERSGA